MNHILSSIWIQNIKGGHATLSEMEKSIGKCFEEKDVYTLENDGLVKNGGDGFYLTTKGRNKIKVVVCGGVFDILHPGHAFILDQAKTYGDVLVVVVARDSTVEGRKRIPIVSEKQRVEMISHLKPVDVSMLGHGGDYLKIIEEIRPDVIALGPDQHHDAKRIKEEMAKRGLDLEVVRIKAYKDCELNSTRAILQRIIEQNYPNSRTGG